MTVVVVIPVLGRAERIAPLVQSLRATTDTRLVFVCSPDDDALEACNASGEEVIVASWHPARGDFAKKTNLGFRETSEEWIFCGATDLVFRHRWLENAIMVGERSNAGVVGTQDLGNALVRRGTHSTHPLVRRAYIERYGGAFDRTGEIYSETYSHQYVDLELVELAKLRKQWAFAKRSVVEHLHPNWRKAEWDATYEKAFAEVREDRALYVTRMRRFEMQQARKKRSVTL